MIPLKFPDRPDPDHGSRLRGLLQGLAVVLLVVVGGLAALELASFVQDYARARHG